MGLTPKPQRTRAKGRLSGGTIGPKKGVKRGRPVAAGKNSSALPDSDPFNGPLRRCRKRTMAGLCKARLTVTIGRLEPDGANRWFVILREGLHSGHPEVCCSLLARPTKLLNVDEVDIAGDALATHGGSATARALYFYRTGDLIDRRVLHRIVKLRNNASLSLQPGEVPSEADRLVAQMRGDPDIDYIMFYHESGAVGGIVQELGLTGEAITTDRMEVTDLQQTEIESVRLATRLSPQSHLLLSVMWVRRAERKLFRCNPSVLFIDFTANTNVEKKPFFMGTGVTATNEGIVVFRALTPNEKLQWTDNIMAALPRLLGQETFRKVSVGIGDECGNEIKYVPWQPVTHH